VNEVKNPSDGGEDDNFVGQKDDLVVTSVISKDL
jgi:hypothetical protein